MPIWSGFASDCFWEHLHGIPTVDEVQKHVDTLRATLAVPGTPVGYLSVMHDVPPPPSVQRKTMARVAGELTRVRAFAMVSDSTMARVIITGLSWLGTVPFEQRAFRDPNQALEWLAQLVPTINPKIVAFEIRTKVPRAHLWPAWT
jgi:hypothetical protein